MLSAETDCLPEGFTSDLATVLEGGAGSNLGEIRLNCDSLDSMREIIGRILRQGACPKLHQLRVELKEEDNTISWEDEGADVFVRN